MSKDTTKNLAGQPIIPESVIGYRPTSFVDGAWAKHSYNLDKCWFNSLFVNYLNNASLGLITIVSLIFGLLLWYRIQNPN